MTYGRNSFAASGDRVRWRPGPRDLGRRRLVAAMRRWGCSDIAELHRRSVREPEWFWPEACADLGVTFSTPPQGVADESGGREFPRWFPGARINVADSCVFQHAA